MTGGSGFSAAALLSQPAIQTDLKVSADQKTAIGKLLPDKPKPPRDGGRPPRDTDRAKRQAEAVEIDKKLTDLLLPEQTKRLQQLIWQQRGTHALRDKEVADALLLTDDQRERIGTIQDEAQRNMWPTTGGGHRTDPGWHSDEFWKDVSEKTLLVLTPEQRSKWKTMMGEPFHGDVRIGPPRFDPRN